jgi:hypothetical protein
MNSSIKCFLVFLCPYSTACRYPPRRITAKAWWTDSTYFTDWANSASVLKGSVKMICRTQVGRKMCTNMQQVRISTISCEFWCICQKLSYYICEWRQAPVTLRVGSQWHLRGLVFGASDLSVTRLIGDSPLTSTRRNTRRYSCNVPIIAVRLKPTLECFDIFE